MILKNDYGKAFIELEGEEFIYNPGIRRCSIRKADIRSVFYDDDRLGILTYSGKIYSLSLTPLLFSEISKLKELRGELNKENILFNYTKTNKEGYLSFIFLINPIISNLRNIKNGIAIFGLILLIIYLVCARLLYTKVIFNIDKDEFEIISRKNIIKYNKQEVDKLSLEKYTHETYIIKFKKEGKNYNIIFKNNPYLMKNYNVSLVKLFNKEV